jgi:hypothetical protein
MQFISTKVLLISSIIVLTCLNSCKKKYEVEAAAIDTLISKNKKALDYLQVDLVTINERKKEIAEQLKILDQHKPDTVDAEFFLNYEKYKGILKIYTRFIENYDVIYGRVKYNEKQLAALKNSLIDEKITAAEYKIALGKERDNVNDNLTNAEVFGRRIFQLEPDYQRLSHYFDLKVNSLIKSHPELKPIEN